MLIAFAPKDPPRTKRTLAFSNSSTPPALGNNRPLAAALGTCFFKDSLNGFPQTTHLVLPLGKLSMVQLKTTNTISAKNERTQLAIPGTRFCSWITSLAPISFAAKPVEKETYPPVLMTIWGSNSRNFE
ncbi:hypothetical protein ACFX2J_015719 [Malus domestica]